MAFPLLSKNVTTSKEDSAPRTKPDFIQLFEAIKNRIMIEPCASYTTVEEKLDILHQLATTPMGCFLLENKAYNSFWADYSIGHPSFIEKKSAPLTTIEKFLLEKSPGIIAIRERYKTVMDILQSTLFEDIQIASLPCGTMTDLLNLDYSDLNKFTMTGVDQHLKSLEYSIKLANNKGLTQHLSLIQDDAWNLNVEHAYHVISCHGFTVYEYSEKKVENLFKLFHKALKPSGMFVTSFWTPGPDESVNSPWDFSQIDEDALRLRRIIYNDIIHVKWKARSLDEMAYLLSKAGFDGIEFSFDTQKMCPVAMAYKKR